MGKEGQNGDACTNGCVKSEARYTWEEVQKHDTQNDKWLVIDRKVYNITAWSRRHPGGVRVISHFAGEDASEAFFSFHPDLNFVRKFLKPLYVGELAENEPSQDREKNAQHIEDFLKLRKTAEEMNLFKPSSVFFGLCLAQNVVLEILAWASLYYLGTGWIPTLITILLLTISQAQAGWLQHDLGHLSVFKTSKWNHCAHKFIIGHLKGASANWWNHRHFQHHAKPNILSKDPDVNSVQLFVLGNTEPVEFGMKKIKFLPYNHQHQYFFLIGPPLLIPLYFTVQIMRTMISRKDWVDLSWSLSYYARYFITFVPFFGFFGAIALLNAVRFLESHWFVWVTQMNHIPMEIDHEKHRDWLACQLAATCNLEPSYFNDWFTGHLNFQIEHHLFPTMPRHNYSKISPLVRSLCKKHNINYEEKTLYIAVRDVVGALKKSGKLWLDAYLHK